MKRAFTLALSCVCASSFAQIWVEGPDAPEMPPGQLPVGAGPLTTIIGSTFAAAGDFADMYMIEITSPAAFSATTVGGATWDTALYLFDLGGMGVTFNDDSAGTVQSTITGAFVPGPGCYFLAISPWDYDPLSFGGEIWADMPFTTERAPDGPGAAGPITGWAGPILGGDGAYTITLTGATYCSPVPEPFTMGLAGLALAAAARRRLRKTA